MAPPIELEFSSTLDADRETVWATVSTMDGVNDELHPWIHMTAPSGLALDSQTTALGEPVLRSWLLAFGLVPFDRHTLTLTSVDDGHGFIEESQSWMQRRWRHERTLTDAPNGCTVSDWLTVEPRIALARPIVAAIVGRLFAHRHRRLRERFGSGASGVDAAPSDGDPEAGDT